MGQKLSYHITLLVNMYLWVFVALTITTDAIGLSITSSCSYPLLPLHHYLNYPKKLFSLFTISICAISGIDIQHFKSIRNHCASPSVRHAVRGTLTNTWPSSSWPWLYIPDLAPTWFPAQPWLHIPDSRPNSMSPHIVDQLSDPALTPHSCQLTWLPSVLACLYLLNCHWLI